MGLLVADAESGGVRLLAETGFDVHLKPVLSADGTQLAYVWRSPTDESVPPKLRVVDIASGAMRRVSEFYAD